MRRGAAAAAAAASISVAAASSAISSATCMAQPPTPEPAGGRPAAHRSEHGSEPAGGGRRRPAWRRRARISLEVTHVVPELYRESLYKMILGGTGKKRHKHQVSTVHSRYLSRSLTRLV